MRHIQHPSRPHPPQFHGPHCGYFSRSCSLARPQRGFSGLPFAPEARPKAASVFVPPSNYPELETSLDVTTQSTGSAVLDFAHTTSITLGNRREFSATEYGLVPVEPPPIPYSLDIPAAMPGLDTGVYCTRAERSQRQEPSPGPDNGCYPLPSSHVARDIEHTILRWEPPICPSLCTLFLLCFHSITIFF